MAQTLTEFDTIAAISTPIGEGGISIVRMSGEDAVKIANEVFKGADLTKVPTHTIHYGHIIDPDTGKTIDESMVTVLRAPLPWSRISCFLMSRLPLWTLKWSAKFLTL